MTARGTASIVTLAALLAAPALSAAMPFTFDTVPADGAIGAAPGDTVGWGYTISNPDASLWLLITAVTADPVQHGTIDTSPFDFPVLAPLGSIMQVYDPGGPLGLAQFTWDITAPPGFINAGTFQLEGEFYDGDPFAGGSPVDLAESQTATYRVRATQTSVPEPGSALLVMAGLVACTRRLTRRPRC